MHKAQSVFPLGPGAFRLLLAGVVVCDHFADLHVGRAAVYLFFALSGFWVHRMWAERYRHTARPYLTFMASRLWRLAPVMLLATALSGFVHFAVIGIDPATIFRQDPAQVVLSHVLFLGYSSLASPRLLEPAWSLDIEMQFYLAAPLLAILLARFRGAVFAGLCAGLVAFDMVFETPAGLTMLAWFAAGMLASTWTWRPSPVVVAGSLAVAAALLGFYLLGALNPVLTDPGLLADPARNAANIRLNGVLALLLMPVALHSCCVPEQSRDRLYGGLSYIIYLVHWPFAVLVQQLVQPGPFAAPLAICTAAVLSLAIWHYFDRPIQRARARWVARRAANETVDEAHGTAEALAASS